MRGDIIMSTKVNLMECREEFKDRNVKLNTLIEEQLKQGCSLEELYLLEEVVLFAISANSLVSVLETNLIVMLNDELNYEKGKELLV